MPLSYLYVKQGISYIEGEVGGNNNNSNNKVESYREDRQGDVEEEIVGPPLVTRCQHVSEARHTHLGGLEASSVFQDGGQYLLRSEEFFLFNNSINISFLCKHRPFHLSIWHTELTGRRC